MSDAADTGQLSHLRARSDILNCDLPEQVNHRVTRTGVSCRIRNDCVFRALVSQWPMKAFHLCILDGLSGLNMHKALSHGLVFSCYTPASLRSWRALVKCDEEGALGS